MKPRPHFRLQRQALSVAAMTLILAGCAAPAPETWRVAPNYRITHAGASASANLGYTALTRQYAGEGRWREARDVWRKAALAMPEDADTLNALGMAEAGQGLYGNAIAALRRAVVLAPQRTALRNNLGYALLLDGQREEAKSVLNEVLARSPDHLLAQANLNRIHQPATRAAALQITPNVEPLPLRQTGLAEAPVRATPVISAPLAMAPRIEIINGNGVTGLAASLRGWLRVRGLTQNPRLGNAQPFNTATTVVHYRAGYFAVAQEFAGRMPQRVELAPEPGGVLHADIRVVLGRDLRAIEASLFVSAQTTF